MMQMSASQSTALVTLRVLIGWHFLYEGLTKIWDPYWSSAGFLNSSEWLLSGFFQWIAATPVLLAAADWLNQWGLLAIGFALIAGLFSRPACYAGFVLLLLYFFAHPPLVGLENPLPVESSYLIVNKNLIEAAALLVLALFPTSQIFGLDRLRIRNKS